MGLVMSVPEPMAPITGTFFWLGMCFQASALPVVGPNTATTFSLSIRSVMFWIDFGGCDRSSRTTSTTLRPSRPPAALMSSMAVFRPSTAAWPLCAEGDADRSPLKPILMSWASACCAPAASAMQAAVLERRERIPLVFIVVSCVLWKVLRVDEELRPGVAGPVARPPGSRRPPAATRRSHSAPWTKPGRPRGRPGRRAAPRGPAECVA